MKNLILSTAAVLFASQFFSQDLLTLRSGIKYQVKLLEITDTDLRFKMYNNQEGPVYTINRNNFESIVYQNGLTEEFALKPTETPQTVTVNGYNISASATLPDQTSTTGVYQGPSPVSQTPVFPQKKATFGEVMNAIFVTGMVALDVAAKIENTRYTQQHQHSHHCKKH